MKPDGQFYWIDPRLPEDTRLSPQDRYVWMMLNSFTDDEGQCYPAMDTLAKRAGMNVRTVQRSMRSLCKTCWVTKCHQTSLRTTLYQLRKPEGYQICHSDIPIPTPYLDVVKTKKKIVQVPKREVVHKRASVSHIPKIIWNRETHQLEYDDKARLTFDLDFPGAGFDKYIGKVRNWIVRTGKIRLNYWKSMCSFVLNDRKSQNTMPLENVPSKTVYTAEERKAKEKSLYEGFGDNDGDDSIHLIDGKS